VFERDEFRRRAREAFEARWREGDPWGVDDPSLDLASSELQRAWLADRR